MRPLTRTLPAFVALAIAATVLAGCTHPVVTGDTAGARLRVAAAAEAGGNQAVALGIYATAAASDPGNMEVQARYARALIRAGELGRAEALLGQAARRYPGNSDVLRETAKLRLVQGRGEDALRIFDTIIKAKSADDRALTGRGIALDLLGRHREAQASHLAARVAAPDSIEAANNLAVSMMLEGRSAEAAAVLREVAGRPGVPQRLTNNLALADAAAGAAGFQVAPVPGLAEEDMTRLVGAIPKDNAAKP